jgi:hypothetical protein
VTGILDPVDPVKAGVAFMKERVALILVAGELGLVPDEPVAPDRFRCFACRRDLEKGWTAAGQAGEYRRRFGKDIESGDAFTICDDCNQMIAADIGIPL